MIHRQTFLIDLRILSEAADEDIRNGRWENYHLYIVEFNQLLFSAKQLDSSIHLDDLADVPIECRTWKSGFAPRERAKLREVCLAARCLLQRFEASERDLPDVALRRAPTTTKAERQLEYTGEHSTQSRGAKDPAKEQLEQKRVLVAPVSPTQLSEKITLIGRNQYGIVIEMPSGLRIRIPKEDFRESWDDTERLPKFILTRKYLYGYYPGEETTQEFRLPK
jgi:hypothetical protein